MSTQPTHEQTVALVDRFYDRSQVHPTLGPVFNAAVDDWDEHKRLLVSFWTSVVLRAGTYRGNPMSAHRPHPITTEHFVQWLELWRATADEILAPEHAELLHEYRSEEHTSELQSLMRISYAVFCLKKKTHEH